MASKKQLAKEEMPVDKLDELIKNNYKKIVLALLICFCVFVVFLLVRGIMKSSHIENVNKVSQASLIELTDNTSIENFILVAGAVPEPLKSYVNLLAGESYSELGLKQEALKSLDLVSGDYKELAASLLYDLNPDRELHFNEYKNGLLSPVWYYRAVLNSKQDDRVYIVTEFESIWPDSALLSKLREWGLDQ